MNSKILRALSIIMVLALTIGLLPIVATASDNGSWVPVVEEDFDNFADNGWGVIGSGTVAAPKELVARFETSENLNTGITKTDSELNLADSIKVSFDAKINSFTDGHDYTGKPADNATLALMIHLDKCRFMFAIEDDHLDASSTAGTWANDIALDATKYNTATWQHYELIYTKSTGIVDVYVNGDKVGEGSMQTRSQTFSKIDIWANGDENNHADAYLDNLKVETLKSGAWSTRINDDFDNLTDSAWITANSSAVSQVRIEEVTGGDSALVLESKQNLDTGVTKVISELAGADSFKIAFDAKVESFTDGHSTASKTADNASLGMKFSLNGSRIMFAIEEDHLDTSNGGTWSNDIALDASKFNTANWQHYEIIYVKSTGIFEVYVNGTKVGEGAKQTHAGTTMSGINIWANGDENNYAKSYLDNLTASVLSGNEWSVVFEDDFNNLTDAAWGKINGTAVSQAYIAPVRTNETALELSSDKFADTGAKLGFDVSVYDKFKISFKGKINKYTTGHGDPDCTTLGLNVGLGDRRIMFAVEKDHIDLSSTAGTWAVDITLDSAKFNTSDWQTYDIIYDKATHTVDVYVNGEKVGSGGSQARNSGTYVQFWTHGYDATNASNAYVDDFSVSYWLVSGLPTWESDAKLDVTRNDGGFTVSWPAADDATSYDVTVDGVTVNVTGTSYTATGLELVSGGHTVSVVAKNDEGVSPSTLSAVTNPQFDPEVHDMDIEKILIGNTSGGDGIYSHYRIPGIVVTKQDTVIMYFEARTGLDDWSPMDLLVYRSTDGGNSFDEPIKVVEGVSTGTTINNPTMIVGNDGTLHLLYCVEYGICTECNAAATSACTHGSGVFYTKSTNDGVSWSTPVNISDSTAPNVRNVFAVGPGHGICLDDGTLLATVWYVRKDVGAALESHYTSEVATIYSTNNGVTWQLGEEVPNPDNLYSPNETMLAKTSDGRVMLSIRTVQEGYRAVSWSDTGYSGWSDMKLDTTLVDPTCMGSLCAYDVEGYPYMILSSNCNSTSGRRNITLRASLDDGTSWEKSLVIDPGLAGYSDIAVDSKGTIYVLYEVEAGLTVNLARLTPAAFGVEKEVDEGGSDNITTDGGSADIGVNGEFIAGEADTVVSVSLNWTVPEFVYTVDGEWDEDKLITVPVEGSGVWSQTPATITVINHSNQDIGAAFSFATVIDGSGIVGKFTSDSEGQTEITEVTLESAATNHVATEANVYFFITDGELSETHEDGSAIGNITITISAKGN